MTVFMEGHYYLFMLVILSLFLLIVLRSIIGIIIQLAFFAVAVLVYLSDLYLLVIVFFPIQVVIVLFLLYSLKRAIDYSYEIVLEKTHLKERYYTKNDYTGIKKLLF